MDNIINIWDYFKDILLNKNKEIVFNRGLSNPEITLYEEEVVNLDFPSELYRILCNSNGQTADSIAIFIELRNNIMGENILRYRFLPLNDLIHVYNQIQHYSQGKIDKDFIPFALYNKKIEDKGSVALTLHRVNKRIYKTRFYEYDRFTTISDYSSEQISENLNSFLENQILWYNFLENN